MGGDTPFSFHCMICFEEFHPEERYPVVLPCGHTYVCHCCANRLEKCMECRVPLYELVPHSKLTPNHSNARSNAAAGGLSWSSNTRNSPYQNTSRTQDPPPQPPMKRRLALPKNVVLLSLIEATELASKDARQKFTESPKGGTFDDSSMSSGHDKGVAIGGDSAFPNRPSFNAPTTGVASIPDLQTMGSIVDMDDDEVDVDETERKLIEMSTSLAVGVAGTYAVAAKEGLQILTTRPISHSTSRTSKKAQTAEEDVETLVRVYHNTSRDENDQSIAESNIGELSPSGKATQATDTPEKKPGRNKKDPKLCYGDRVQIVSVDGGWAKLARGYGFVLAENNNLVKVSGSLDRACKLEAMLGSLSNRRRELRIEQSKIDNQFIRFMNELQHSLQNDEDLTVILADTFSAPVTESFNNEYTDPEETAEERNDYPQKPANTAIERSVTPPLDDLSNGGRFSCFAGGVFGDSEGSSRERSVGMLRCSALANPELAQGLRGSGDADSIVGQLFSASSHPSPSAMRAGAQAWREQHGRAAANEGAINFRTGMSGHMALLSTQTHAHEYLEHPTPSFATTTSHHSSTPSSGTNYRMSSHTGLTMTKLPTLHGIFSSFTLPHLGTPSRQETNTGQIHHTGSM